METESISEATLKFSVFLFHIVIHEPHTISLNHIFMYFLIILADEKRFCCDWCIDMNYVAVVKSFLFQFLQDCRTDSHSLMVLAYIQTVDLIICRVSETGYLIICHSNEWICVSRSKGKPGQIRGWMETIKKSWLCLP